MMSRVIPKSVFSFLKKLEKNNDREWFNAHKEEYRQAHQQVIDFADDLLIKLKERDRIETVSGKKSLMRIYRDVRFSKDKRPYDPRFAGSFSRVKPQLRGGYFFRFKPGETVVGGGLYKPEPSDLKLIRDHIAQDDSPLRDVISNQAFKDMFGELQGEQLKTAPKGFDKDHQAIDLLRYKSMYVFRSFKDEEVHAPHFQNDMLEVFTVIRPFFDLMTEFLTTDLNGISLIDE